MRKISVKKLDIYIIKKFLGTYFGAILLIILIAVIFDFSEKIDDFLENNAPFNKIIVDYYLNFIPYFAVLFAPLFTFIAVIFFTSRMAYNTEVIAILSSGVSFKRLLWPYFLSATVIMVFNFSLGNYIIPKANGKRFAFEENYYHNRPKSFNDRNVHKQIEPGIFVYFDRFNTINNYGLRFSIEKFEDGELVSKLLSKEIHWDSVKNKWEIRNYHIRDYINGKQIITSGSIIDTALNIDPSEFRMRDNVVEAMTLDELKEFIDNQKMQGSSNVSALQVERHRRFSFPFSTFILTLIGVSVSSRKVRGGIGMHIGIGLLVSFSYILFMQFSAQYAISGALPAIIAMWIPNFLFAFIAYFLYRLAPK
ncbi:MAG: LptF/LptG family permease [Bacteroidales bacterium]|nr:LptF/LptG family permease [Bacteroidales bacterium]